MVAKFISIEGVEGVGKSTVVRGLATYLQQQAVDVVVTREPGGSPTAEAIRDVLMQTYEDKLSDISELLLMFASRTQHLEKTVLPALQAERWVLCDRFVDASYAYQGGGRGIDLQVIEQLEAICVGDLRPDLTILLDAPVDCCLDRLNKRGGKDRIECESSAFFQRVRDAYLARAKQDAERIKVIDGARDQEAVLHSVCQCIEPAWLLV